MEYKIVILILRFLVMFAYVKNHNSYPKVHRTEEIVTSYPKTFVASKWKDEEEE